MTVLYNIIMENKHINLKERIENILKNIQSKQFASRLKKFPIELNELEEFTKQYSPKNISEQLFILLKGPPSINECGQYPLFDTFEKGYRTFCGSRSKCQCSRNKQRKVITDMNNSFSDEKKQEIQKKREQTNLKKYGFTNPALNLEVKAKVEQTNLKLYGAPTPVQSSIVQEKIKQTCLEKYGVETPFQNKDIQQKSKDTTLQRYGKLMSQARAALYEKYDGLNPFAVEEVKEKAKSTLQKKYGRTSPKQFHLTNEQLITLTDKDKLEKIVKGTSFKGAAIKLGVSDSTIARYCRQHNIEYTYFSNESTNEIIIKTILDHHNIEYISNDRSHIKNKLPLELDFFLPKYNIAIEVGSIFNHSELNSGRGKKYHWHKWNECRKKEITLYQWFDDELKNLPIIENKILYITNKIQTNVGARKTKLVSITSKEEHEFLDKNHIQGFSSDRSFSIGASYNSELVAVMTFASRAKYIELTRYATKLGSVYPGLFSKMFKFMLLMLPNMPIISFSANCHSNGNLYIKNGFVFDHYVEPTYFYTLDYHSRLSRNGFMKSKLLQQYPNLDSSKTEWELVQELGYDRCWDAGKIAWRYDQ